MKFFTREWATGGLSDDEFESVAKRYQDHLERLDLPAEVFRLANVDLHDGVVNRVEEAAEELELTFVTGDQQGGYFETIITYANPLAWGATMTFLQFAAGNSEYEVLEHEVDRLGSSFIHHVLFSSNDEAAIVFSSVAVTQIPRSSRS
jgi:hypothetical protein